MFIGSSSVRRRPATGMAVLAATAFAVMGAAGCSDAENAASSATSAAGSVAASATGQASSAAAGSGDSSRADGAPGAPSVLESATASAPAEAPVPSTSIASPNGEQVSITDAAVIAEYAARGYDKGYLGKPLGPVVALPTGGKFETFEGGSIYLNPATGKAYTVHGALGGYWGEKGHENGPLGYPAGEETSINGGLEQKFDRGTLRDQNGTVTQLN